MVLTTLTSFLTGDGTRMKVLRWSLMGAILFWVLVYRMSVQSSHLPNFVYVNF